jgi:hypothetical protein
MKRPLRRACAALAATIVAAAVACPAARAGETSRGGAFLPLGWDARGMSLGGAATVLVRGEESAYWNPANLSYIDGGGVSIGMVQLVEGLPSRYSTFSAGIGFGEAALDPDSSYRSHRFAMALSISQLGLELAGGSGWDETTLGLSAAYAFTSYSSVGLTIRGLKNKTDLADAGASGWAVDLGLTERITRRIIHAIENPHIDIVAHPTCRLIGEREPTAVNTEAVFHAAAKYKKVLEINAMPVRLDLKDIHTYRAREQGVMLAIGTDAHTVNQMQLMRFGIGVARRGWCQPQHLLNCLPAEKVLAFFKR